MAFYFDIKDKKKERIPKNLDKVVIFVTGSNFFESRLLHENVMKIRSAFATD
jgi:hypothetical protein